MEVAGAKEMPEDAERKGLGTPATRAAILEKLVATGFVERKKSKKGYFCERNDCHFGLWRDNRFLAAKKINLTKKMAEMLLKDGKTYASGIFSEKTGKTYDAYIVLEDDGQRSAYKLEFSKERRK